MKECFDLSQRQCYDLEILENLIARRFSPIFPFFVIFLATLFRVRFFIRSLTYGS